MDLNEIRRFHRDPFFIRDLCHSPILTIKPVNARKNIKVRDYLKTRSQYAKSQKLYFLKPQKRGDMESELEKITTK